MTATATKLIEPALLTTSAASYYTVPSTATAVIKGFPLHNTSTGVVQVTIHLVENGGTVGDSNQIFKKSLAAHESLQVQSALNATLSGSDQIYALADTASAVSITAAGTVITT